MLYNRTIAVVVPAYNEEKQIGIVIESMPDFVDRVVIVNDCSSDRTAETVMQYIEKSSLSEIGIKNLLSQEIKPTLYNGADIALQKKYRDEEKLYTPKKVANHNPEFERIILINHLKNGGVGAAISTGYQWCRDHGISCTSVMAGDGQMDPSELESICTPVINDIVDYVKGNRLIHRSAWLVIPRIRFFGNSILSMLTKVASGYWNVSDTQTGYTAISLSALKAIDIHRIYKSYGMPNDLLVKLNIALCTLKEVEIKPVYNVGEKSKMKILKVIPRVSWLLVKLFFKRLWVKYFFRDFHPLFLLYNLAFVLFAVSLMYGTKILYLIFAEVREVNPLTILAYIFVTISAFQSLLFAMWMDIQDNERLIK